MLEYINELNGIYFGFFQNITNRIMRCIARKEWTSALGIFSALKRVILLQPDIDRICDAHQKDQLAKVLNRLHQTVGVKCVVLLMKQITFSKFNFRAQKRLNIF